MTIQACPLLTNIRRNKMKNCFSIVKNHCLHRFMRDTKGTFYGMTYLMEYLHINVSTILI